MVLAVRREIEAEGLAHNDNPCGIDRPVEQPLLEAPASEDSDDEKPGARARRLRRSLLDAEGQTAKSRWLAAAYGTEWNLSWPYLDRFG